MSAEVYAKWLDEIIVALTDLKAVASSGDELERIIGRKGMKMMLENQPDFSADNFLDIANHLLISAKKEHARLLWAKDQQL